MEQSSWIIELYDELKEWQTGVGAFLGFLALMAAALWNFRLNRRRDAALRDDEALSVAIALYGEVILLRQEIAKVAKIIARSETQNRELTWQHIQDITPPAAILYPALASSVGLLPSEILLPIVKFYSDYQEAKENLPMIAKTPERDFSYDVRAVLIPAKSAVDEVEPTLRQIEALARLPEATKPDTGHTEIVIELLETPLE